MMLSLGLQSIGSGAAERGLGAFTAAFQWHGRRGDMELNSTGPFVNADFVHS